MRLIDVNKFIEKINDYIVFFDLMDEWIVEDVIESMETIDPETLPIVKKLRKQIKEYETKIKEVVVHGKWEREYRVENGTTDFKCSNCGKIINAYYFPDNYCRYCGACMDI